MRGFKSFAEKTSLDFEPGVTVVVGPNGSGKSNVVDALAWVLGTHSPKSLRGGQMADVIFAGARGRSALGRASVEITIDNAAGTLPVEFSEVTVSRAMFASGENDYAINGEACRALDVQELLSDTGLGRENHTIVGQGRLDAILNARPEERRSFIEEAAGILKHRRRKERALRKLTSLEGHLERLHDVLREVTRNLRPLERQAEAAAKHAELTDQLTEVRRVRAVRELAVLADRWEHEQGVSDEAGGRIEELENAAAGCHREEAELEAALADLAPQARRAGETHFRLAGLVERFRGLTDRIEERRAGLVDAVEEPVAGRDPDELRARAQKDREALGALEAEREEADAALARAEADRRAAEQARRAHEQAAAAEARRRTEARERQLRWEGEVSALRSSLAQAAGEEGRLASQRSGLEARRAELESDISSVQNEIQRLDAETSALGEQVAAADQAVQRAERAAEEAAHTERDLERRRASLEARAEALRAASEEATEGAAALSDAAEQGAVSGIVGPMSDVVEVEHGMARAVAAALGPLGEALVADSRRAAAEAVGFVRSRRLGRALLLAADADDHVEPPIDLSADGARPLSEAVNAQPGVVAALRRALAGAYAVDRFDHACRLAERYPGFTFVSRDGELAGAEGYAGGSSGPASSVLSRAAAEQAESELEVVQNELLVAHRRVADADRKLAAARHDQDAAQAAMSESDAAITSAAERLGRLRKELATCEGEREALAAAQADLAREIEEQRERLTALERRGETGATGDPDEDEGADLEAERLDDELTAAREREVQARLAASAVAQRGEEAARRVQALEEEAEDVEQQLAERERRRERRLAGIERCRDLVGIATAALRQAETSLEQAAAERDRLEADRAARQEELGAVRARSREIEEELAGLRETRHAEELRRAELRHALDAVRERLGTELGADPDQALADARAHTDGVLSGGEERDAELADEEGSLTRKLGLLGTINPLALSEYEEMQERHRFLTEQLEDLRASRKDLNEVVEAVDERIREVFEVAFTDVAAQFERVFPRLFPGGEGRLVLTDPEDMLHAGVDVEARPPGKRVKRLSLLSGGERSLTALAVLFAIFAARPSPFYVLDEVEAALDDVNLQRFLAVVEEFRSTSQLILITHQKRTMEIADQLYGVTMNADGTSKVVSQRQPRDPAPTAS